MFLEKNVYQWINHRVCVERKIYGVETQWLYNKGKVFVAAVSKEGHADILLVYEGIHHNQLP